MLRTPLDAMPDLSDVQVIVFTEWAGRSPDLIEDQVTYPIVTALIPTPNVNAVRGFTDFGISFVYVIFEDGTDIYWARSRVLEYLQGIRGQLPEGVNPTLGPDATGVGWVFQYALVDRTGPAHARRPAQLPGLVPAALARERARRGRGGHHRRLREAVPGEPRPDTARGLRGLAVSDVVDAIRAATTTSRGGCSSSPAASTWSAAAATSSRWATSSRSRCGADERGTPVRVGDVARVALGPEHPARGGGARRPGRGGRRHRRDALRRERARRHRPGEGPDAGGRRHRCRRAWRSFPPTTAPA